MKNIFPPWAERHFYHWGNKGRCHPVTWNIANKQAGFLHPFSVVYIDEISAYSHHWYIFICYIDLFQTGNFLRQKCCLNCFCKFYVLFQLLFLVFNNSCSFFNFLFQVVFQVCQVLVHDGVWKCDSSIPAYPVDKHELSFLQPFTFIFFWQKDNGNDVVVVAQGNNIFTVMSIKEFHESFLNIREVIMEFDEVFFNVLLLPFHQLNEYWINIKWVVFQAYKASRVVPSEKYFNFLYAQRFSYYW